MTAGVRSLLTKSVVLQAAVTLLLAGGAGVALVAKPTVLEAVGGMVIAVVAFAFAADRPAAFLVIAVVTLAFFPFVASVTRGPVVLDPGLLLLFVFLASQALNMALSDHRMRLTPIDVCTLLLFAAMLMSVVAGVEHMEEYEYCIFVWLLPYMAGRFATAHLTSRDLSTAIILSAICLVPFVVYERTGGVNLFLRYFPGAIDVQAGLGVATSRLGSLRAQAGFGQPILLAVYLSIAAVLAFGRSIDANTGRRRAAWLGVGICLALAQSAALARTGWVVLAVGLLWLLVGRPRKIIRPGRVAVVALAVAIVATLGAFSSTRELLGGGNARIAASGNYRSSLLTLALQPGALEPFGTKLPLGGHGPTSNSSIDDEYVLLASNWGYIAGGLFLALLVVVCATGWRDRAEPEAAIWAAAIGSLVALFAVAFIAQDQIFVWLLVGACSGLRQRTRPEKAIVTKGARRQRDVGGWSVRSLPRRPLLRELR